jgi:hypothetical protein
MIFSALFGHWSYQPYIFSLMAHRVLSYGTTRPSRSRGSKVDLPKWAFILRYSKIRADEMVGGFIIYNFLIENFFSGSYRFRDNDWLRKFLRSKFQKMGVAIENSEIWFLELDFRNTFVKVRLDYLIGQKSYSRSKNHTSKIDCGAPLRDKNPFSTPPGPTRPTLQRPLTDHPIHPLSTLEKWQLWQRRTRLIYLYIYKSVSDA